VQHSPIEANDKDSVANINDNKQRFEIHWDMSFFSSRIILI
jgi:hypothetical protein